MRNRVIGVLSTLLLLAGMGLWAQNREMARHEPHMSAALGHLQQAKDELQRATPNKGGHREKAMELINQAIQQVQEGEQTTSSTQADRLGLLHPQSYTYAPTGYGYDNGRAMLPDTRGQDMMPSRTILP